MKIMTFVQIFRYFNGIMNLFTKEADTLPTEPTDKVPVVAQYSIANIADTLRAFIVMAWLIH